MYLMFIKYKIFLSIKIVKSMLQFTIFVLIKKLSQKIAAITLKMKLKTIL